MLKGKRLARNIRLVALLSLAFTTIAITIACGSVQAGLNVQLNVKETLGFSRHNEMVHNGIPISRDENITSTTDLVIKDASGIQIPATFEVLSRWAGGKDDGTRPVKWLLVSFPASVVSNETRSYYLTTGTPLTPDTKIVVTEEGNSLVVNTGPAKFVISTTTLSLFESVSLINDSTETVILESNGGSTSTIAGQSMATANDPGAVVIERNNDHYVCIRVEGTYANSPVGDNARPLSYKIRYEFFAGSPAVTIYHKFFWNGYFGDIAFSYPSSITVDDVSLVFPDMNGYSSTDVYADAATFLTGALTNAQTASVEQKLRTVFSNPNQALVEHGSASTSTTLASKPMLINRSASGVIATTIDHMQYFEPQSMETDHTGKVTVNVMAGNQIFANAQGTWARVGFSVLPSGATYEDTVLENFAPLNNRLFAFPNSGYVTNSKVFLELPSSPEVSTDDKIQAYYNLIKSVTEYTESFLHNERFHGLMTWGSLVRYKSELGSGTGWDKIYSGAALTDYHNAWNGVVFQYLYEGDPTVLYDMSFIGARRMLHTQIIQPDETATSSRARGYMGWAPAGYRQFRSDPNSSHSYFENLYNYYYMTGDMEVIEVLKPAGVTKRSWYTRDSNGNLNDQDTPEVSWAGYTDRVGFQSATILNFLGHAYDGEYLDDFIHMYNHAFSQNIALLSNGDGHEYGFVTATNGAPPGFRTSQFWMTGLYFTHGMSILHNEWGDLTLGSTGLSISRVYEAVARSLMEYVPNIQGDGTWGGNWSNTALVDYTGDRIGGTITSVTHGSSGGDQYLWNTGKSCVLAAVIRGGHFSGDSDLIAFGMEGLDWLMGTSSFYNTDRYPWGKINGIMLSRFHHSISYLMPGISINPPSHHFENTGVGSNSPPQTFTVSNTGDAGITMNTISLTGTDTFEFFIQNDNCSGQTLLPSESCTVDVVFSPVTEGGKNANLNVPLIYPDIVSFEAPLTGVACNIEICYDGIDNDCDGLVDCEDPDCQEDSTCSSTTTTTTVLPTTTTITTTTTSTTTTTIVCQCPEDRTTTGCISGAVTKAKTEDPLAGKTVKLRRIYPRNPRIRETVVTGNDGCYIFSNLYDGVYKVVTKDCRGRKKRKTVVISDGSKANNINLRCR